MAIRHLSHIGVCVSDLEASRRFYRDQLGFEEVHRLDVDGASVDTLLQLADVELHALYLQRDGFVIELLHYASPGHVGEASSRPMNALGLTHFSVRVDDLDQDIARLRAAGAKILEETRTGSEAFQAGAVFVTDPDGTRIELVQAPGDPTKLPGQ